MQYQLQPPYIKEKLKQSMLSCNLNRIAECDRQLNCFTTVTAETALKDAAKIDAEIAQGNNQVCSATDPSCEDFLRYRPV